MEKSTLAENTFPWSSLEPILFLSKNSFLLELTDTNSPLLGLQTQADDCLELPPDLEDPKELLK